MQSKYEVLNYVASVFLGFGAVREIKSESADNKSMVRYYSNIIMSLLRQESAVIT